LDSQKKTLRYEGGEAMEEVDGKVMIDGNMVRLGEMTTYQASS
jgi:hypothetical protein